MKCTLIFDHLNDIVYRKYNRKFAEHLTNVALAQNLIEKSEIEDNSHFILSSNVIIQIFSPIVTSQRVMTCQFGNSYTSIRCQDGINIVFNECMGYLFMQIGNQPISFLKRLLGISISFVRHLCGPDVYLLKNNESRKILLSRLVTSWEILRKNDQSMLVEAIEQLMVNADLGSATLKALQEVTEKLKSQMDLSRTHAMILVQNKFMSLYSSRNANDLSPADIIFISLLTTLLEKDCQLDDDEYLDETLLSSDLSEEDGNKTNITYLALLMGNSSLPSCIPHMIHIVPLTEEVRMIVLVELGNNAISSGVYEIFHYFNVMQIVQMQKDSDAIRPALDNIDNAVKKVLEAFKKTKNLNDELDKCQKKLTMKWDSIRKKYLEFLKTSDSDCVLSIESNTTSFIDTLRELLELAVFNTSSTYPLVSELIDDLAKTVHKRLASFSDFLKVKAIRNFTLGSSSLTINKYLEEFPGLVHFLYIDRINHRITAPSLDFTSEETMSLTKQKIWSMVEFAHNHVQQGHLAFMWKDTTFNYAYFVWFEDSSGASLKPKLCPANIGKTLSLPGILATDFYKKLTELCFPKQSHSKIRCFELFCIHLGLATSSCVLEHTRRLAATIWDVTGMPNHPIDLL